MKRLSTFFFTMALLAMPLVMINMGGEMIYILEQRLRAQSISQEKSSKGMKLLQQHGLGIPCLLTAYFAVLADVVACMFNEKFIEELFRPQPVYSQKATRLVFDRLAHSSIMRLNTNSMDKVRGRSPVFALCRMVTPSLSAV